MAAPKTPFSTDLKFFLSDNPTIRSIYKSLNEWGCCPKCALRFLGEKESVKFQFSQKEIHAYFSGLSTTAIPYTEATCSTCLGVLQQMADRAVLNKVNAKVKDGSQHPDFRIAITLPVAAIIREHALLVLLLEHFPSTYTKKKVEDFAAVKDVWKMICTEQLGTTMGMPYDSKSSFDITLVFEHTATQKECDFLKFMCPQIFRERKNNRFGWEMFTRNNVRRAVTSVKTTVFKHYSQVPPKKLTEPVTCSEIICSNEPIYLAGRYNKLIRTLSQTPWIINGVRKTESSVQERICSVLEKKIQPEDVRFSASGREDVDVRMLGKGRPFMIEFQKPKNVTFTQAEITKMQEAINASTTEVKVNDLQMVKKEDTAHLIKAGEMTTCKSYTALCWNKEPINKAKLDKLKLEKDLKVDQKTPIRVLHRRVLATREKIVHSLSGQVIDEHRFKLNIRTGAGTYIKEFVHGDFSRTKPNLRTLLDTECDVLELDVMDIELDWPPKIEK